MSEKQIRHDEVNILEKYLDDHGITNGPIRSYVSSRRRVIDFEVLEEVVPPEEVVPTNLNPAADVINGKPDEKPVVDPVPSNPAPPTPAPVVDPAPSSPAPGTSDPTDQPDPSVPSEKPATDPVTV